MDKSGYITLLKQRGFFFFLVTQFLGAMNDNIYRLVVSLILVKHTLQGGVVSLTAIVFLIPAILFSGYAGYLADKYSKRNVLIITKSFEVLSMLLAYVALGTEYTGLMMVVLFTMATQSAFFSPSKYGIIPEMVTREQLSHANGLVEMTTYVAIIIGASLAGVLMHYYRDDMMFISTVLVVIAVLGVTASFGIQKVSPKDPTRKLRVNPYSEIFDGLKLLKGHLFLTLVVIGICYFWAIAMALQLNLLVYAGKTLKLGYFPIAIMQTVLALGIAMGALLAGKLSGDRIEYGLIPLGLLGVGLSILSFFWVSESVTTAYILLVTASLFVGLYIVPLKALQQDLPDKNVKGRLIATTNVFTNVSMIASALILWTMQEIFVLTPQTIFLIWGLITLAITGIAIYLLPAFFIRFMLWVIMHTVYRVKVFNEENIPKKGPALLVCNHVSYIDALILSAVVPHFIRYLIHRRYYDIKIFKWLIKLARSIPIETGDADKVEASLQRARKELENGHVVCVFAEGRITRTGNLLPFKRGFERITEGLDAPIIPVHLDKLWDSIFSFRGGRFFWKFPRRIPVDVAVSFGKPMPANSNAWEVRQQVQELGSDAEIKSQSKYDIIALRFLQATRFRAWKLCAADNHDEQETYGSFVAKSLLLAEQIKKRYRDEKALGILLPPSVRGAWVNVACILAGKTVVNVPYHEKGMRVREYIEAAGLNKVITTSTFLDGLGVHEHQSFDEMGAWFEPPSQHAILWARIRMLLYPARLTLKHYGEAKQSPEDVAAVLWSLEKRTLGKPVALSNRSILTPVASFSQVFDRMDDTDKVIGVLPFNTTMGMLGTLWFPLLEGMSAIYHTRAKHDSRGVGSLIKRYNATIIFDTPQAYRTYYEDLRPEVFSYIRYGIVGAREFSHEFLQNFEERFGIELLEGYGHAETGPISVNIPNVRIPGHLQVGMKPGSAGQPLPYVSVKIVDPDSFKELEQGQVGLLLVKSPFRMVGYLNDAQATREAFTDGWYNTGEYALLDDDGFLFFPPEKQ